MSRPYPERAYVGDIHVPDESIALPQTYRELLHWNLPSDKYEIFDGREWVRADELQKRTYNIQLPDDPGVALTSASHPRPPWWKRLLFFWRLNRRLRSSSITTVDLEEIKPAPNGLRITPRKRD